MWWCCCGVGNALHATDNRCEPNDTTVALTVSFSPLFIQSLQLFEKICKISIIHHGFIMHEWNGSTTCLVEWRAFIQTNFIVGKTWLDRIFSLESIVTQPDFFYGNWSERVRGRQKETLQPVFESNQLSVQLRLALEVGKHLWIIDAYPRCSLCSARGVESINPSGNSCTKANNSNKSAQELRTIQWVNISQTSSPREEALKTHAMGLMKLMNDNARSE